MPRKRFRNPEEVPKAEQTLTPESETTVPFPFIIHCHDAIGNSEQIELVGLVVGNICTVWPVRWLVKLQRYGNLLCVILDVSEGIIFYSLYSSIHLFFHCFLVHSFVVKVGWLLID